MDKNIAKILLGISSVAIFSFFVLSNIGQAAAGQDFSVSFLPINPTPNTDVTARITSYQFDVNRSTVVWELDGEIIENGLGKSTARFTTPDLGKNGTLNIYITTENGEKASETIPLSGNDIDILWEAITYTPYWYKGKALPVSQSQIKVTAIPYLFSNGGKLSSSNLIYEWFLNNKKDARSSGAEKNLFVFRLDNFDNYSVGVRVSNANQTVVFEKYISLSANEAEPKIIFYKDTILEGPLYGIALKDEVNLTSNEIGIYAEPFFFSDKNFAGLPYIWKTDEDKGDFNQGILYNWQMNGKEIIPTENPNTVDLRISGESSGFADIILNIRNMTNVMQSTEKQIRINF
jgi:hypothetical protein